MSKCQRCINFPDGSNGSGYMPCSCNKEPKPEFVQPPPLVPIGRPRLGWKPKQFKYGDSDPYKKFNTVLLVIFAICMIVLGMTIGVML